MKIQSEGVRTTGLPDIILFLALLLLLLIPATGKAAELKHQTLKAWSTYVEGTDSVLRERIRDGQFLWIDESPETLRQVRSGDIAIAPIGQHTPQRIPSGLIHHWMGAAFLPGATVSDVLAVVRDYGRYKEFYNPSVVDSRPIDSQQSDQAAMEDHFATVLASKFLKTVLENEYQCSYMQAGPKRWYSVATTTHVWEIESYGQSREHRLQEDAGSGYVWRMHTVTRFEERDGGVYMETEVIALSRDIPAAARWIVEPIVQRVSKDSLMTSLRQTQDAVRASFSGSPSKPGHADTDHDRPAASSVPLKVLKLNSFHIF